MNVGFSVYIEGVGFLGYYVFVSDWLVIHVLLVWLSGFGVCLFIV